MAGRRRTWGRKFASDLLTCVLGPHPRVGIEYNSRADYVRDYVASFRPRGRIRLHFKFKCGIGRDKVRAELPVSLIVWEFAGSRRDEEKSQKDFCLT